LIDITDIIHSAGSSNGHDFEAGCAGLFGLVWVSAGENADVSGGG
jgi:hypothetical protein